MWLAGMVQSYHVSTKVTSISAGQRGGGVSKGTMWCTGMVQSYHVSTKVTSISDGQRGGGK